MQYPTCVKKERLNFRMKKLLILLPFLPTFIFAEDFYLICEGVDELYVNRDKIENTDTKSIEVSDNFITFENNKFTVNDDETRYFRRKNELVFSLQKFENSERVTDIYGTIDRVSGVISVRSSYMSENTMKFFNGKCKKTKERAF